jgi:g-D-glutamyl-meso-diaminopimelate peptidase
MSMVFDESIPLDYDGLLDATKNLKERYSFFQSFSIGKSFLGRQIIGFNLGGGKPDALYVGGVHALEYITSMVLLKFTAELCDCMQTGRMLYGYDIKKLLGEHPVYIIPMLNPDGVEIHLKGMQTAGTMKSLVRAIAGSDFSNWQANARGVDLNHNFNAGYELLKTQERENGILGPAVRQYGGPRAESEPETRALCYLCRHLMFKKTIAFHSQGEEIYWNYGNNTPRSAQSTAKILAASCGYSVAEPEGMASNGGFKDWFIKVFHRPGFTIELGLGKNPLPVDDLASIYKKITNMLLLGLFV